MDNNTILVIDDDRNILSIIELYLKKAGFNVATCATGYDALSTFRSVKPTLVVLDVMLPGRDGWSILNDYRLEVQVRPRCRRDIVRVVLACQHLVPSFQVGR